MQIVCKYFSDNRWIMSVLQYSKDGLYVNVWYDSRKIRKDGGYPVKIRVTFNRRQQYYSTGKSLTLDEWESLHKSKSPRIIAIRKDIESSYNIVRDAAADLAATGSFSFDALRIRLKGAAIDSVNYAFKMKIDELKKAGRIGNMDIYKTALKSLEDFAGEHVPFKAITVSWLVRFTEYLRKRDLSQNTIAIRLRTLKAIFNDAKTLNIIREAEYPFGKGKYEIQSGTGRKMALLPDQIKKIFEYDDGLETSQKYRDYFLFLYLCNGINVADFIRLKYSDIINDEIYFKRQKTMNTVRNLRDIRVIITEPMRQIIRRWGNPYHPNNYIFPHLDGTETPLQQKRKTQYLTRLINRRMAYIAIQLEIPHISTYTARHSFATILKNKGINISYISEALGHSDIKTTENYLASFDRTEREKMATILTEL